MSDNKQSQEEREAKPAVDTSTFEDDVLVERMHKRVLSAIENGDLKATLRELILRVRNDALSNTDPQHPHRRT